MIKVKKREISQINTADLFTDREYTIDRFSQAYDLIKENNVEAYVMSICGIGGIGKSVLLDKIIDILISKKSEYFYYSFETNGENQKANFLLNFAYQILERKPETDISQFIYAYKRLLRPGETTEQVVEELARKNYVKKRGLVELASTVVSDYLPFGGNTFSFIIEKALNIMESAERKKYKDDIMRFSKDELSVKLPEYFSNNVFSYFEALEKPYVVFIDGYEKYISPEGNYEKNDDSWLMEMVESLPNVLWIFSGREPLDWPDEYEVEKITLEGFSSSYVKEYFNKYEEAYNQAGVNNEILSYVYELTQGVPFYLRLCLDNYDKFPEKDKITKEDIGKNTEELLRRFFNNYSESQKMGMYYLCCLPDGFTEEETFEIFSIIDTGRTGLHYDLGILYSLVNTAAFETNGNGFRIHSVVRQSVLENAKGMENINVIKAITQAISKYVQKYEKNLMWGQAIRFRAEICRCWETWGNTHNGWEEYLSKEELLLSYCYNKRYRKFYEEHDAEMSIKCCDKALNCLKMIKEPWDWSVLDAEYDKVCAFVNKGDWDTSVELSEKCFELVKEKHANEKEKVFKYVFYLWNQTGEINDDLLSYMDKMLKEGLDENQIGIREKKEYIQRYHKSREVDEYLLSCEEYIAEEELWGQMRREEDEKAINEYEVFINEYDDEKIYDENSIKRYKEVACVLGWLHVDKSFNMWSKLYDAEKRKNEGKDTIQSIKILMEIAELLNDVLCGSLIDAENTLKKAYEIIKSNKSIQRENMMEDIVLRIAKVCEEQEKIDEALKFYRELRELQICNQIELIEKECLNDKIREMETLT